MGKILILTGLPSSGKTTLRKYLLKYKPLNLKTINRKKILEKSLNCFGESHWFKNMLLELSLKLGKVITLQNFFYLKNQISDYEESKKILQLCQEYQDIHIDIIFKNYVDEIQRILNLGYNIIIDDSSLFYDADFLKLKNLLDQKVEVKRILLYSSLPNLINKCAIRNNKFLNLLKESDNPENVDEITIKLESETNDSGFDYRDFNMIIYYYNQFFYIKNPVNLQYNDIVLDKLTLDSYIIIVNKILMKQKKFDQKLKALKYIKPNDSIKYDISSIDMFKGNSFHYIVPKTNMDFILIADKFKNIELLKNENFLQYYLHKIIYWLHYQNNIKFIFQEWNLWSRCFGEVLILNGVSSSGKTTLSQQLFKFGFIHISMDAMLDEIILESTKKVIPEVFYSNLLTEDEIVCHLCGVPPKKSYTHIQLKEINLLDQKRNLILENEFPIEKIIREMSNKVYKLISHGNNVIVDILLDEKNFCEMFLHYFSFQKKIILLYTPLEKNLLNCYLRNLQSISDMTSNYRMPFTIIEQFFNIYQPQYIENRPKLKVNHQAIAESSLKLITHFNSNFEFLPYFDQLKLKNHETFKMVQSSLLHHQSLFVAPHIPYDIIITFSDKQTDLQLLTAHANHQFISALKLTYVQPLQKIVLAQNNHMLIANTHPINNIHSDSMLLFVLNQVNSKIDYLLRKFLIVNNYREMQNLINKYNIKINVVNDESLKSAYKKLAFLTHPDKTTGLPEELRITMKQDFIKANNLLEFEKNTLTPIIQTYNR